MTNNDFEIRKRRSSTNVTIGLILVIFVVLIFSVTLVKLSDGDKMQAYDHVLRPEMLTDE